MQGSLYTRAKACVPQRLQGTVEAAEGRVADLAAPYLPALLDRGASALRAVDAKVRFVCDHAAPAACASRPPRSPGRLQPAPARSQRPRRAHPPCLLPIHAQVDSTLLSAHSALKANSSALAAAVEQQRAAVLSGGAATLDQLVAARAAYLERVEAAVGALKEQGLQGTAKVRAAGCGVCDAVQPAVAGPPLAGLRGCGLLAGLVRVLPAGSAYCC